MRVPALTDDQFEHLRALLARAAGLVFDAARRDSLGYSVAERLRVTGEADVDAYLGRLDDPQERQRLLDEVTIQETHFFRNPPQVRALRQHVLPALLRAAAGTRRLRVWSAGCSTGEEPYTIAMMLRELLPTTAGWDVRVLGTDVSERALAAARTARYGPRAVQMATPADLARFFVQHPDGSAEVRPEVRELVELRHHNLVTEPVPFGPGEVDLVLCRNVTIYFGKDTTRALMGRLHTALRDGGYLFLGHSETLWQVSEDFRLVPLGSGESAAFVYRRLDAPTAPGAGARALPERRSVLPDRRTLDEPVPLDRRTGPRRSRPDAPATTSAPRPSAVPTPRSRPVPAPALVGRVASPATAASGPELADVRAALQDGRYDDAVALADDLTARSALLAEAHYLRGLALVSLGAHADALVSLRKAVYLEPASGLAHFLLAGALERTGDAAAARREYRAAAASLSPRDAGAPELGGRSHGDLVALCTRLSADPLPEEGP